VFKRSLKLEPESIALRFTLTDVYLSLGRHADAVQQLLVALELKDSLSDQMEVLTRIVVIDPTNLPYRLRLAETHERLGNIEQARSAFGYVLGELLRLEDTTTASTVLDQLVRIDTSGEEVRKIVAQLIEAGETGSAEWLVTARLRDHPTDLMAMDLLSKVLGNTGRGAETFTILLEKSSVNQADADHEISPAFQNMITRQVTFGRPDVRTNMNATVQMNFMASTMELNLKEQEALLHRSDEPLVTLELEEVGGASVDLHLLEAAACIRLGLRDRAEEHLKMVIEEDPNNERAFEMLDSLY
jgi:tetratricopeptide (TPR) repeat protein